MAILNDDMKRVVRQQRFGFIATVCPDGTPNLSPKGTTAVWDDEHLIFADLASPTTMANLRHNPALELNVVDVYSRKGYRFKGRSASSKRARHCSRRFATPSRPAHGRAQGAAASPVLCAARGGTGVAADLTGLRSRQDGAGHAGGMGRVLDRCAPEPDGRVGDVGLSEIHPPWFRPFSNKQALSRMERQPVAPSGVDRAIAS